MYKPGPRHHSNSHTSKQVPRARVYVGSPFRGESNFVHVLRDFRAHQPRRSCQHRLQVPKTALHKSPGVAELRSYRRRFDLRSFSLSSWCCVSNAVSCIRIKFDNPMLVIASVQLRICCSICSTRRRGVRPARGSCRCPERQDHLDAGKLKPLKDTQRIDEVTAEAGLCQSFLGNFVHCCCFWSDSFLFALVGGAWRSRKIRLVVH